MSMFTFLRRFDILLASMGVGLVNGTGFIVLFSLLMTLMGAPILWGFALGFATANAVFYGYRHYRRLSLHA